MTYLIEISYSGVNYSGFQIQPNAKTIAGELSRASKLLFGADCKVQGCSRTDAGVHAKQFFCSVHVPDNANKVPADRIPAAMNCLLPYDIAVINACAAPDGYNPRFETVCKEYCYIIYNRAEKNPFFHKLKLPYPYHLDEEMLDGQAKDYIGKHDFTSFMAVGSDVATTVRTVYGAGVIRDGDDVIFSVSADGFLYNMVRIMVGTLLYISEGKIEKGAIPKIIEGQSGSRFHRAAGRSVFNKGSA